MGKVMSSVAARANQRFNIENRAQRVIASEKPRPAPKYEANVKDLERILKGKESGRNLIGISTWRSYRSSRNR
jgi:hypothetical protein